MKKHLLKILKKKVNFKDKNILNNLFKKVHWFQIKKSKFYYKEKIYKSKK